MRLKRIYFDRKEPTSREHADQAPQAANEPEPTSTRRACLINTARGGPPGSADAVLRSHRPPLYESWPQSAITTGFDVLPDCEPTAWWGKGFR